MLNWPPLWLVMIVGLDGRRTRLDVSFLSAAPRVPRSSSSRRIVVTLYFMLVSVGVAAYRGAQGPPRRDRAQPGDDHPRLPARKQRRQRRVPRDPRARRSSRFDARATSCSGSVAASCSGSASSRRRRRSCSRRCSRRGATRRRPSEGHSDSAPAPARRPLGLAVLLALVPSAIVDHVIGYRTRPGNFGFSGAFQEVTILNDRFRWGRSSRSPPWRSRSGCGRGCAGARRCPRPSASSSSSRCSCSARSSPSSCSTGLRRSTPVRGTTRCSRSG